MKFIVTSIMLLFANLSFAQVTIIDEELRDGILPTAWTETNIVFETSAGGYARFSSTSATLTTSTFDASTYNDIDIDFNVAKFGSGGDGPITVEYSLDGGSTWTVLGTSPTPTNSTYLSTSLNLSSLTSTMRIRFSRPSSPSQKRLRDVQIIGNGSSSPTNDTDSKVIVPTSQIAASSIISDEVTLITTSQAIFSFNVQDLGSGDGLPTEISQIGFVPGANNTADWSDIIQGIRINAGGINIASTNQTETILDNEISLTFDHSSANVSNNMSVDDGTTKEFIVSVYLNETNIVAGDVIQLEIEQNSTEFQSLLTGSAFENTFDAAITGNQHTISIPNRNLLFKQQPQITTINENMNTAVEIAFVDNNDNINNLATQQITINSSGSLLGAPLTVSAINGIATFNSVIHDVLAENINLTASSSGMSDLQSTNFSIVDAVQIFISEVVDPGDVFSGRYIEIFNSGMSTINFDTEDYYIVREANGGPFIDNIKLEGSIAAKAYYIIGKETDFFNNYNFYPDLEQTSGSTIDGNGDDSYFISRNGTSDTTLKNSIIDIYGEVGVQAISSTPWYYEDSRAVRNIPGVTAANQVWQNSEWIISSTNVADATPGYGENDYVYRNNTWSEIGLGVSPDGVSTDNNNIYIVDGDVTFTSNTVEVNDLIIRSGATLRIENNLKVSGDILNQGNLIFLSDASQTASLGEMSSSARVSGEFESRRYIPQSNRAFRYLSSPVNSTTSIRENLQEGTNNTLTGDANNQNPNPGFGTHITGSTTGSNGFDATLTGNPSMFYYNNTFKEWENLPNTNVETLEIGKAFAIMIRGDRNTSLSSNESLGSETILRFTGNIHIKDFEVTNLTQGFNLVGNPYQAPINVRELLNNSTGINKNFYYLYEPTIDQVGKNVSVAINPTNTVANNPSSNANVFVQAHQAFFVEATSTSPELIFKEEYKNINDLQTQVFSEGNHNTFLQVNLKKINANEISDGLRIRFGNHFADETDQFDASKIWNSENNLASINNQNYFSFDSRPFPQENTIVELYIGQYSDLEYSLNFEINDFGNIKAYLIDNYLNTQTEIGTQAYQFNVDYSIPESVASNRFQILFENETLSNYNLTSSNVLKIFPNPSIGNHVYLESELFLEQNIHIEIVDLMGRILYKEKPTQHKLQKININSLPSSALIIKVKSKGKSLESLLLR